MERYHGEKQVVGKQLLTLRSSCMNLVFLGIGVPPCHGCLHNPSYPNLTRFNLFHQQVIFRRPSPKQIWSLSKNRGVGLAYLFFINCNHLQMNCPMGTTSPNKTATRNISNDSGAMASPTSKLLSSSSSRHSSCHHRTKRGPMTSFDVLHHETSHLKPSQTSSNLPK